LVTKSEYRYDRGQYKVPPSGQARPAKQAQQARQATEEPEMVELNVGSQAQVLQFRQPKLVDESDCAIPTKYPDYVPFGFYKDLFGIVKSKMFYPVFVTGLSGNGKTLMVEQVCAELKRECIRVNISIETDDTDLLGSFALINGNTIYRDGPVLQAMKKGAILLIDEVDRADDEFEAFLLELLSDFQITIPEIGTIKAESRPIVILTSNRTRELHDALKRRCLYNWIGFPPAEQEVAIVKSRVPNVSDSLASQVVGTVNKLREMELEKSPGVAETIDWVESLDAIGAQSLDTESATQTLGSIIKGRDDLEYVSSSIAEIVADASL
jgi:MoxR-like ATPase